MPDILVAIQDKIKIFWNNLDKSQKYRLVITVAVLLATILGSIYFITRKEYVPLISNADSQELGQMTKILDAKKINYLVSDDRKSLSVDKNNNNKAQAALVQEGYPKSSGMTFDDAFNKIKINSTEADKKKLWEEYKAKSLGTKLKMLENVEDADVTLAMPEQSIFITGKQASKPTANVVVKTKNELNAKQVDGIIKMVASSVENLNPKDVTVVDTQGNVLSDDTMTAESGATFQYDMTQKKKKELEKSIKDMFVGQFSDFEGIRVSVNPVLDFNSLKTSSNEVLKPEGLDNGALISKKEIKENLTNGATGAAPGADTNPGTGTVPTYQIGGTGNSNYTKSDKTENFEFTKVQKEQEKSLGDVIAESTTSAVTLLYGDKVKDASGLTPEFIQQVKEIASKAAGIPVKNISVTTLKVLPVEVIKPTVAETIAKSIEKYGLFALLAVLGIAILIALIPRRKSSKDQIAAFSEVAVVSNNIEQESELPDIHLQGGSEVKKQIEKFVTQNPDSVAQLLRNWLGDDYE
ncbi:MAG: flagellar M-ring protein FliF [Clostridiaceae bacterium]|nr:flagellar M-ring protein FliF [Clostridiaceae bacterium]